MVIYFSSEDERILGELKEIIKTVKKNWQKVSRTVEKEVENLTIRTNRAVRLSIAKVKDTIRKGLKSLPEFWEKAFTVDSLSKQTKMAQVYGQELAAALYDTQLRLTGMEHAMIRVAAPIAGLVLPVVNGAADAFSRLANTVARIVSAFVEGTFGVKSYEKSLKSVVGTTASLERHLAGFDQIQRLGKSGSSGLGSALIPDESQILPGWEKVVSKLQQLWEPLKSISFSPAIEGANKALKAFQPVLEKAGAALEWVYLNLLVPLAKWAAETVLPTVLEVLTSSLQTLGQVLEELRPIFTWLWENVLQKLALAYGEKIVANIQAMGDRVKDLGDRILGQVPLARDIMGFLDKILGYGQALQTDSTLFLQMMQNLAPVLGTVNQSMSLLPGELGAVLGLLGGFLPALDTIGGGFSGLKENAGNAVSGIKQMLGDLWSFVEQKVLVPSETGTRGFLNRVIGYFEKAVTGISSSFNQMFGGLGNNLEGLGTVSPSIANAVRNIKLRNIYTSNIPRLARGAVLPANKPFMAVVGDQKNGTNIEAPLSTIQQALDLALADRLEGMMAGFNAVTARQEKILEAILGLDVSDGALAGAVARYERRMSLATGGI